MAGFGATVRAGAAAIALTVIAQFVGRVASVLIPFLNSSPAADDGTVSSVSRTITFVEIATGRLLLIFLLSVVIFWMARSYLNSEVRV
jgi:hypothetical protein